MDFSVSKALGNWCLHDYFIDPNMSQQGKTANSIVTEFVCYRVFGGLLEAVALCMKLEPQHLLMDFVCL